eukprot:CAMPEP_0185769536 /NCGR_PEP_ID=MMETSP1174-20130828/54628_1 /TAXON_ID=35687 /ORGANISM="Dictyocha speculum, Strain CCMP1381" /LENGTH=250 /DNA_ID=CAMNT_0028454639 /DNA_START=183 /DNA_END=935 /DNA_ORIENTATION=+
MTARKAGQEQHQPLVLPGGFAQDHELAHVRETVQNLERAFSEALGAGDSESALAISKELTGYQHRDPLAYYNSLCRQEKIAHQTADDQAELTLLDQKRIVKHFLPGYRLGGLWVCRSGPLQGQIIEVSYENDVLIATRIYTKEIVPTNTVIFRAIVSPDHPQPKPIEVADVEDPRLAKLECFEGEGGLMSTQAKEDEFLPGRLVIVGDLFAFAIIPLEVQIFFRRCPAETVERIEYLEKCRRSLGSSFAL